MNKEKGLGIGIGRRRMLDEREHEKCFSISVTELGISTISLVI